MDTTRIEQALESGILKMVRSGDVFKINYDDKVDFSKELHSAYKKINYEKVFEKVTSLLEEKLAEKIVNKIVTEMGTDMKKLMCNPTTRDDFKFFLRQGVEKILSQAEKV